MRWIPVILILPYVILLLKIYRSLSRIKTVNTSSDPSTFISIVVACRNEERHLPFLLNKLALQSYPTRLYEVIIVDDNSTDSTFEIAVNFNTVLNILAVHNEGSGKKQAIRSGIRASSGKLILTTDADCVMGNEWVRTIVSFFEKNKPDLIVCPVKLENGNGLAGRFQELEFLSLQGVTAGTVLHRNATMCNGANLAFTRQAYMSHSNDMHEELISGDDIFFLHSLKRDPESKIMWLESPDGIVTTALSKGLSSFLNQRARWISKTRAYSDKYTIYLTIVTSIAIFLQLASMIAGLVFPVFLKVFIAILILKSVPDLLILTNICRRYNKSKLMTLFPVAEILYPFYVLSVIILAFRNAKSAIQNPKSS